MGASVHAQTVLERLFGSEQDFGDEKREVREEDWVLGPNENTVV